MKTNVPMNRKMGDYNITQRTKDSYFNATELLKQWNGANKGNKKIVEFERLKNTKEFINELENDIKSQGDDYHFAEFEPISVIKGKNTKKGKTSDIVWYNPYLFIKFAMWLNPRFELHVIKFVYDQLIESRHEAGDNYKGLSSAVQSLPDADYPKMAKGLNWIVFNNHYRGIRQDATEAQLKELTELQKKLRFAIDMGYIDSFGKLLKEMRRMWHLKWNKSTFEI